MKKRRAISKLMMVDTNIGIKRPYNFPLTIKEKLLVDMGDLDKGPRPVTITTKSYILWVMVQAVNVVLYRLANLPC